MTVIFRNLGHRGRSTDGCIEAATSWITAFEVNLKVKSTFTKISDATLKTRKLYENMNPLVSSGLSVGKGDYLLRILNNEYKLCEPERKLFPILSGVII